MDILCVGHIARGDNLQLQRWLISSIFSYPTLWNNFLFNTYRHEVWNLITTFCYRCSHLWGCLPLAIIVVCRKMHVYPQRGEKKEEETQWKTVTQSCTDTKWLSWEWTDLICQFKCETLKVPPITLSPSKFCFVVRLPFFFFPMGPFPDEHVKLIPWIWDFLSGLSG